MSKNKILRFQDQNMSFFTPKRFYRNRADFIEHRANFIGIEQILQEQSRFYRNRADFIGTFKQEVREFKQKARKSKQKASFLNKK